MGVNEWGVTIGNEAVHTREATHERALIGMDLVRLGLERARTASDAVAIIGALIERYGQGGSCEATHYRTYQNSFIIAGVDGAWILETAGHRWVAKQVGDRGAISNLLTLSDWDRSSPGIREHAEAEGWWKPDGGFAAAYQDPDTDLTTRTCRLERARQILCGYQPGIGIIDMMGVLTDHGETDLPIGPQPLPTLCVHANPAFEGETAAAMVVSIRPDRPQLLATTIWTAFGSPCLSLFRPVYPYLVGLPEVVSTGGATYDPASPWWISEHLQRLVARAPASAGFIRDAFATLQRDFFQEAEIAELHAAAHLAAGNEPAAIATLRALVDSTTDRALTLARTLTTELPTLPDYAPLPSLAAYWDIHDTTVGVPPAIVAEGVSALSS
jgi:secernin